MRIAASALSRHLAWILLFAAALPCFGGEVAVLKNGFAIRHERREIVGDVTRLYVTADGSSFVDVPTADLDHFEAAPDAPAETARTGLPASGSRLPASAFGSTSLAKAGRTNATAPAVSKLSQADITAVVKDASGRYQLDPDLVDSVIKAESGFHVRAVSPKGAQGLMQLMPGTASKLGVPNAFDPQANVEGGTKYLRELLERYNFDMVKALAAYNAGPQRVERFGGVPPFHETRAYVTRIVKDFNKKKLAEQKAAAAAKKSPKKVAGAATSVASKKTPTSSTMQAKASSHGQ
jgi:hypothetical protein